jgi:hypothetical protein
MLGPVLDAAVTGKATDAAKIDAAKIAAVLSVNCLEFGVRVKIPTYLKLHSLFLGPGFRFAMRNARAASICCWK